MVQLGIFIILSKLFVQLILYNKRDIFFNVSNESFASTLTFLRRNFSSVSGRIPLVFDTQKWKTKSWINLLY